jgi:dCMP deaminase
MNAKRLLEIDRTYLRMAREWSRLSRAIRKRVGCLIVKDGTIIADGFNGTPTGFNNSCETIGPYETGKLVTKPEVLHAETNAITKLAKSTQSSEGSTMYITISPCVDCAKLMIQAGIKRVVYSEVYRDLDGVDLLKKASIITERICAESSEQQQ